MHYTVFRFIPILLPHAISLMPMSPHEYNQPCTHVFEPMIGLVAACPRPHVTSTLVM